MTCPGTSWPVGIGEMAERVRSFDWAATALGPVAGWPQSLRTAVDIVLAMPSPATILWGPTYIQIYNDAYIAIARDRHPAILGLPVAEGWPDVYEPVIASLLATTGAGRATRLTDFPVMLREENGDWEERAFDTAWSPIRDEAGMVAGALQTLMEVTDRHRSQQALRESEARFRGLVEGFGQFSWEASADGVIVADSPGWRAHTGQSLDEWRGYGWLEAIHPDDRADTEAKWRGAVAAGRAVDSEYRLWHAPSRSWRWSNVRAVPIASPDGKVRRWAGVNIDVSDRRVLRTRLELLVHELQHRTRNLLDVVDGIARQTLEHTGPNEHFVAQFNDRLAALARVQELLVRSDERRVTIGDIVRLELDALAADLEGGRVRLAGPEVGLRSAVVQTIALAVHELATNARKYGALAGERGTLRVTWNVVDVDGRTWLHLDWFEDGLGPARGVPDPRAGGGYGRELIEEALPYALGARTGYRFDGTSVHCEINLPLEQVGKGDAG
jgi:two-component system CheB/CheR fusion protein